MTACLHRAPKVSVHPTKPAQFFLRPSGTQKRTFLDSFISSALGPCPLRKLTHTKTIPYSQSAVFKAVSDVSGYPAFLPFTISSHVTSRDDAGYPTRARLRVGYDKLGFEEDWDNVVHCDARTGVVEAKSSGQDGAGLFEVLSTRWQIGEQSDQDSHIDVGNGTTTATTMTKTTTVKLDVQVKFRNSVYDQLFSQVEDKVAATMITAFEKRVHEIEQNTNKDNKSGSL